MKTILGLIGGGSRDEVILGTALAMALPYSAHMDFLHVQVSAGIAAQYDSHVQFAMGAGIGSALDNLDTKAKTFSELAAANVRRFCTVASVEICETRIEGKYPTASFREEQNTTIQRLIFHASQSDAVVLGRAKQSQGLQPDTLERLIRNCGRPVLVAASAAPRTLTGTILVCWNNSGNVARTVEIAMPILAKAKRVIFAHVVTRRSQQGTKPMHDFVRQLAKNNVSVEAQLIPADGDEIPSSLASAADHCSADLLIVGAYGRSRLRELIFGSRTEALIRNVDRPVLMMH
jgi:nucleotide-binding universal stress UspA family protein